MASPLKYNDSIDAQIRSMICMYCMALSVCMHLHVCVHAYAEAIWMLMNVNPFTITHTK